MESEDIFLGKLVQHLALAFRKDDWQQVEQVWSLIAERKIQLYEAANPRPQ